MAPREEDLVDEDPPAIEPYTILNITKEATADEVKSAYRKAALKHHPDKASEHLKSTANAKFQEIAFAYAVLSDPTRRKRYDATGSTSESIDFDGFSWTEFYQEQFRDVVTSEAIEIFAKGYKGSDEEKDDVLNAYTQSKGKWSGIYETVMLSDPLEDEERFKSIIDAGIESGDVEAYKAYTHESKKAKEARMRDAKSEGKEAMEYARELGVADKLFGNGKGGKKDKGGEDALAALIQKRQAGRSSFLDDLEAKYAGSGKTSKGKRGKKRDVVDEDEDDGMPSEEAFQKAAERLKKGQSAAGSDAAHGRKSKRAKS